MATAAVAPFTSFQQPPMTQSIPAAAQSTATTSTYAAAAPAVQTTTYQTTAYSMEENLYRPENAEFVPAGRPLRGGMTPLYDMTQVRTFEAYPSFQTAAIVQARGVGSELISEGAASNVGSKAFKTTAPSALKKRTLCC